MDIDQEKVEQTVLALLYLTSFKDKFGLRTWKGQDWQVMNSLHEKGYISNPKTKAKSVAYRGGSQTITGTVREKLRHEMRPAHLITARSQTVPLDRVADASMTCRHKNVMLIVTNGSKKPA